MLRQAIQTDRQLLPDNGARVSQQANLLVADGSDGLEGWVEWSPQPFESKHMGIQSSRIDAFGGGDLTTLLYQAFSHLANQGYDFVSTRIPANSISATKALRENGAREIERMLIFSRPLDEGSAPLPEGISFAGQDDATDCANIGRHSFLSDRFHQDPLLNSASADELKAAWMQNNCLERADRVLVARENGKIIGANACLLHKDRAIIDLIGVLPEFQGNGWGRKLVEAAIAYYSGSVRHLQAGTQAENHASVAMYRATGFTPVVEKLTFHTHLKERM